MSAIRHAHPGDPAGAEPVLVDRSAVDLVVAKPNMVCSQVMPCVCSQQGRVEGLALFAQSGRWSGIALRYTCRSATIWLPFPSDRSSRFELIDAA
jgi:hypothetical protein